MVLEISFETVFATKPRKKKNPNGTDRSRSDNKTVPEAPEIDRTVVVLETSFETVFATTP